jgi:hypothetical protein
MTPRDPVVIDPAAMARACRTLAADMSREHAAGVTEGIALCTGGRHGARIGRLDAARSIEAQAARWDEEVRTGVPNARDRALIETNGSRGQPRLRALSDGLSSPLDC